MKIIKKNQLKIVNFTAVKNRCMLHGHVFVMKMSSCELMATLRMGSNP